jgi:hypothetical protein
MKSNRFRQIHWAGALSLLACVLNNCTSDSDGGSKPSITEAGNGSDAGAGGEAAISICQMPAAHSKCDPITAIPCNVAIGETCDETTDLGAFDCVGGPNNGAPGGFCDNDTVFCGPTTICSMVDNTCVNFCCSDSDCPSGPCTQVYTDGEASIGACLGDLPTGNAGAGG